MTTPSCSLRGSRFLLPFALVGSLTGLPAVAAPIDDQMPLQGKLTANGQPVNDTLDLSFCLYDGPDPMQDTQLACDAQTGITVADGIFSTRLDFGAAPMSEGRWIEISVGGTDVLTPLIPVGAAPQATYALDAGSLQGFGAADFAPVDHAHAAPGAGDGLTLSADNYSVNVDPDTLTIANDALAVRAGRGLQSTANGLEARPDGTTIGFTNDGRLSVIDTAGGNVSWDGVAIVSANGGDYDNPVAAIDDRATWCDQSSGSNRCLMYIMPGTYTLPSTLFLRSEITIRGADTANTEVILETSGTSAATALDGSLCAPMCTVRSLVVTAKATGSGQAVGLRTDDQTVRLVDVQISASANTGNAFGINARRTTVTVEHSIVSAASFSEQAIGMRVSSSQSAPTGGIISTNSTVIVSGGVGSKTGILASYADIETENTEIRVGSYDTASVSAISIVGGAWQDRDSLLKPNADSATGFSAFECSGITTLEGTTIQATGVTSAKAISASDCVIEGFGIHAATLTSPSTAIDLSNGSLLLERSRVTSDDDGIAGTGDDILSLSGRISHSYVEAAGAALVNFQYNLDAFFSEFVGTGTVTADTCRFLLTGTAHGYYTDTCP